MQPCTMVGLLFGAFGGMRGKCVKTKGLLRRVRGRVDRGRVLINAASGGKSLIGAPPLLQETVVRRFESLPDDGEQTLLLSEEMVDKRSA